MRLGSWAAVAATVLLLAGCGGDDDAGSPSGAGGSTSAAASADSADSVDTEQPAISAQDLCAFLVAEQPKLDETGNAISAQARFIGDFASFGEEKGVLEQLGSLDLDGLTAAECPQARDATLAKLELTSLRQL